MLNVTFIRKKIKKQNIRNKSEIIVSLRSLRVYYCDLAGRRPLASLPLPPLVRGKTLITGWLKMFATAAVV